MLSGLLKKKPAAPGAGNPTDAETLRRVGTAILVGLSIAVAVASFLQAQAVMRDRASAQSIDRSRTVAVGEVARAVDAVRAEIKTALDDDALRQALASSDEASRAAARLRVRERIRGLAELEFYSPDLLELLGADLGVFGYTRANALTQAKVRGGSADAQYLADKDGQGRLVFAELVRDGQRPIALIYLETLAPDLLRPLREAASGGTLTLSQLRHGSTTVTVLGAQKTAAVPGTTIAVVSTPRTHFRMGDALPLLASENVGGLLFLTVIAALLAALAIGWRGGALVARAMQQVRERREAAEAHAVLAKSARRSRTPVVPADEPTPAKAAPRPPPAPTSAPRAAEPGAVTLERSIFRAYDIRGVVGASLTKEVARAIGRSIGTIALERSLSEIVVGRDGRLHGPMLAEALIEGLRAAGCNVIDIGAVPTPVVYFATFHLNTGSGICVTGSHNPPDYNGFKVMLGGETLAEQAIQDIYARIAEGKLASGAGGIQRIDVKQAYVDRISSDIQLERRIKVVLDAGNGIAGAFAPEVMTAIGCEVEPLHCEVDGNFPNHHPDPGDPHNLQDLVVAVKQLKADLGLAFDGDGDRLGVVTSTGEIVYPDRLLMLFAMNVLTRAPGAAIIYDVKCTGHLQDLILRHGGSPIMWKTGHSLIKAKMRAEDAELAGEMSGHFFFRERWFGFDDGIYAAARLCEILAASDMTSPELFEQLPQSVSTPELKVSMAEGAHYAYVERFREKASFPGARITTIDGVRADYADGWGLVRASNTTPSLVMRFDADTQPALARIQTTFREQMLAIEPGLKLPF